MHQWRNDNIGRFLNLAIQRFETRVLALMEQAGHGGFTLSHMAITRNLDVGGTRATEIARRAGITKQSVGESIGQLEAMGLVERLPDPGDKRARTVQFTAAGMAWLEAFGAALSQAEEEMRAELGDPAFALIRQGLARYGSAEASLKEASRTP